MQTLALVNGDLALDSSGQYMTYTGSARIRQDLGLALSEEYGSDRFHPKWGSVIKQYLGHVITPELQHLVRAEVNRILQNYIILGHAEILRDSQMDIQGRFDTSDVVRSVQSLETSTRQDRILVSVQLETQARESLRLRRQVSG